METELQTELTPLKIVEDRSPLEITLMEHILPLLTIATTDERLAIAALALLNTSPSLRAPRFSLYLGADSPKVAEASKFLHRINSEEKLLAAHTICGEVLKLERGE